MNHSENLEIMKHIVKEYFIISGTTSLLLNMDTTSDQKASTYPVLL